jgi:hypothetical protein
MATKTSTNKQAQHSAEYGNASKHLDSIAVLAADIALASVIQLVKIPAGTLVDRVALHATDMDTAVTPLFASNLGFSNVDGTASVVADAYAVMASSAVGQAAGVVAFDVMPPYMCEQDKWFAITVTAAPGTAAVSGTFTAKVEGSMRGVR